MQTVQSLRSIRVELDESELVLSDFDLHMLAVQMQRNQILQAGLVVSSDDKHPVGLEAIAIALGYSKQ